MFSSIRTRGYSRLRNIAVSGIAIIDITLCSWWIRDHITLTQDALWNVPSSALILGPANLPFPAAWAASFGEWVVPIVTGPYLGPEKSLLLAGFAALGPTWVDASLLFAACAYVVVVLLTMFAGDSATYRRGGLLAAVLLLMLPGFTLASAIDYGPFLLGTAFLLLATTMAFRAWSFGSTKALIVSAASLGIAIGDKFTILPVALPVVAVVVCSWWRHRARYGWLGPILVAVGIAVPILPNFYYLAFRGGIQELHSWTQTGGGEPLGAWRRVLSTYEGLVEYGIPTSGSLIWRMIAPVPSHGWWTKGIEAFLVVMAVLALLLWAGQARSGRAQVPVIFAVFAFFAPMGSVLIGATRPWHLLPYAPFMVIAVSIVLVRIIDIARMRFGSEKLILSVTRRKTILLLLVVLTPVLTLGGLHALNDLATNRRDTYVDAIAAPGLGELISRVGLVPNQQEVSLGYSIATPLVAYAPRGVPLRVSDLTWTQQDVVSHVSGLELECGAVVVGRLPREVVPLDEDQYGRLLYGATEAFVAARGPAVLGLRPVMSHDESPSGLVAWTKTGRGCSRGQ